ncbi:MAG TPA: CpsB/CapC family capsule biosynthesis tyrosine phosphatase, partial [Phycisphaerae bacterium]|nr:CpsB/CapC family capsule biosynthesis tyrosine phosphatase [Phycisphaerae bacterium]
MKKRVDVHGHFLPDVDDGCRDLGESLACLHMMAAAGYGVVTCTPHRGEEGFSDLSCNVVAEKVAALQEAVTTAGIGIRLVAGGEVRLSPMIAEDLARLGVPTYGNAGRYILTDIWEPDWPVWADRAVEWLQKRGLTVIVAHPERMPFLRKTPEGIERIAKTGVIFQGNLGPLGGADAKDICALAERYLKEGRYHMVGTDGHRMGHLGA